MLKPEAEQFIDEQIKPLWPKWEPAGAMCSLWANWLRPFSWDAAKQAVYDHKKNSKRNEPYGEAVCILAKGFMPIGENETNPNQHNYQGDYKSFAEWNRQAPTTRDMGFRKQLIRLLPSQAKIDPEAARLVQVEDLELQKEDEKKYFEKIEKRKQTIMAALKEPKREFDNCKELDDSIPF